MDTPTTGLEFEVSRRIGNGVQKIIKHWSKSTNCEMKFSIFIPDSTNPSNKFHAIMFLPGAFCNEHDFLNQSRFYHHTSEFPFVVVCPDTAPKVHLPGDEDYYLKATKWLGPSSSWYIDAVKAPWNKHYQMYSYVSKELPELVVEHFPVYPKFGICGFSMGGITAIVAGLRNPDRFPSISAFSPNCNPIVVNELAATIFAPLLGYENYDSHWVLYDTFEVAKGYSGPFRKIIVDVGIDDHYMDALNPERLVEAAQINSDNIEVTLCYQKGFGHSFELVKKCWNSHFKHHFQQLSENS